MGLRDYTLFDVIARNARLFRDRTALIQEGQRVTHGEYLARVERLAGGLASAGMVLPNAMRKSSSVPARITQSAPLSASRRERFRNSGEVGGTVPRPMPFV